MREHPQQVSRMTSTSAGIAACLLATLLFASPHDALAHAGLVSSEPGRRAELSTAPKQLRLCFNEVVEIKFSIVTLEDPAGVAVPLGALQADADKPTCVTAALASLADGQYTVRFRVLSVDGHVVEKNYGFSLKSR